MSRKALGAFVAVCVIWGTTYLAIAVTLETMPPFLMAGLRWTLAGTLLGAVLRSLGRRLPAWRAWPSIAVISLLLVVLGNGAVVWAEQFVASGLTAVIIATSPFWMVSLEAAIGGERVTRRTLLGLIAGFMGILFLTWPEVGTQGTPGFLAGVIALQVACAGWAVGSSWSKRHSQHEDVLASAALQMLIAGAVFLAIASAAGEWPRLHFSTRSVTAFFYLAIVGSIGGFAAYVYALKHLPVALVSLYAYVNPVIAVVLGVLLLGEPFNVRIAAGSAIVLLGVALVRGTASSPAEKVTPRAWWRRLARRRRGTMEPVR